jgi:hypothetical protein
MIILGIILIMIAFIISCKYAYMHKDEVIFAIFVFSAIGTTFINDALKEPTAMDVYQGKTTLEITYKDSIPIDSVVVFKNKEK